LTPTPQDDSFREIQLSGKQLFFAFMAATVVSVVIFLCGVLVGRGVRAERTAAAEAELLTTSPRPDAQALTPDAPVPAPIDRTVVPPPPPGDEIAEIRPNVPLAGDASQKAGPKVDAPKPASTKEKPEAAAPDAAPRKTPDVAAPTVASDNWVVQVAAVNTPDDATSYTKRLATKGYSAYVMPPAPGTSSYRVRLGGFKSRREANAMADKLRKDLQVKPWVTR